MIYMVALIDFLLKVAFGWAGWHLGEWLGADLWIQVVVVAALVSNTSFTMTRE